MKNKYNDIYMKIMEIISRLTPDTWSKVWFYGEVLKDATDVYYYFKSKTKNKLICCMDIPKEYDIDEDDYYDSLEEIDDLIEELYSLFKENNENKWTNFTLIFDENRKYDIVFDNTDISNGNFSLRERHVVWRYNVLKMEPSDSYSNNVIKKYLDNNTR